MNTKQGTGYRGQGTARVTARAQNALSPLHWRSLPAALILCLVSSIFWHSSSLFAEKDKDLIKHYGLIYGTAYGPDDHPVYGARIEIHPVGQKHPHWQLMSDHQGEFALRVPPGPADYLITGEAVIVSTGNGAPQDKKKKKIKAEKTVHIQAEERQDVGLHLAEP